MGFDYDDAARILRAAAEEKSPVYRWVPLLCAQSGARVGEICQLRVEDIRHEDGTWYMDIRADAGSVKNITSERRVPLHPHVLAKGFLAYVRSVGSGPLFFNAARRTPTAKKPPQKVVAKNVAAWVNRLGLAKVGRIHRIDPNHGWRHLFRTTARDCAISTDVIDAIQGHAPASIGHGYGTVTLRRMHQAITEMPLPGVKERL